MGPRYAFDVETNGFLEDLTTIHSLVITDVDTGEMYSAGGPLTSITAGIKRLQEASLLIGHNILKFDIPAINKVYPGSLPCTIDDLHRYEDTLVESRLLWSDLKETDGARRKTPSGASYPGKLVGSHSLAAWGHRLKMLKGEYAGGWETWNEEMQRYCEQDVRLTVELWKRINAKLPRVPYKYGADYTPHPIQLEHEFAYVLAQQERRGVAFDEAGAVALYTSLVQRRQQLSSELRLAFPDEVVEETFIPKGNNKTRGYVKGVPFIKRKTVEFNASSRQQTGRRLMALGWKPAEFTQDGHPKIDETILSGLPYPQAKTLAEYFLIEKRVGQVAEGDQAWLKLVKNGRIHGAVNPCGTPTGRCTHSHPNLTQVPKVGKPYGKECRGLFMASTAMVFVGADLSGIELRLLAHFMAAFDGGAYAKVILEGDVHWVNALAMSLVEGERDKTSKYHTIAREDGSKRFVYAFIYGAGDNMAGSIVYDMILVLRLAGLNAEADKLTLFFLGSLDAPSGHDEQGCHKGTACSMCRAGKKLKASFLKKTPALKRLREAVIAKVKANGYLKGLDGRKLHVRSQHSALNTLLQAGGALVAKLATVIAYRNLCSSGYVYGTDFAQIIHAHDEIQTECRPDIADTVGQIIVGAMGEAGRLFNLRLPIAGEYKIGRTWADTH